MVFQFGWHSDGHVFNALPGGITQTAGRTMARNVSSGTPDSLFHKEMPIVAVNPVSRGG
jgi:hypothetical protein